MEGRAGALEVGRGRIVEGLVWMVFGRVRGCVRAESFAAASWIGIRNGFFLNVQCQEGAIGCFGGCFRQARLRFVGGEFRFGRGVRIQLRFFVSPGRFFYDAYFQSKPEIPVKGVSKPGDSSRR